MTATRGASGAPGSLECVVFAPERFESGHLETIQSKFEPAACRTVDAPDDLGGGADARPRAVLYRAGQDVDQIRRIVDVLDGQEAPGAAICVVDDGAWREATAALREGASDYLFVEQLDSPNLEAMLLTAVERERAGDRTRHVRRELEERSSELLGVNALANGVSNTLDREVIIRRGLWVFAGVCQQEATALLELRPHPELVESQGQRNPASQRLERTASFSTGTTGLVRETVELEGSWRNIIEEQHVAVLEGAPSEDVFPGLEPFWEDNPEGRVTLVPVRANQMAIGALVLGNSDRDADVALSRDGLQAMALQFGSALENARLFEKVKSTYESLQETQDQLVHAEKFAAVGILAAEIAHEINNPASFVISNLSVMDEYADSISGFLDELDGRLEDVAPELREAFEELKSEFEIEYLRDDIDALLSRSLSGMRRIHQIVQDLRYLSRERSEEVGWLEVESLLDATVNLVRHEVKFRAELRRDYGDVPQVISDSSRLSQVFLNLLVNAVQSIEEGGVEENYVRVGTEEQGESVVVTVEDTGSGIPEHVQERIFEPFFTTKETGEGTGLGLSISRDIIRSLGGKIDYETEVGEGTTFRVELPIRAEKFAQDRDLRDSGYYETPPGLDEISDEIFE